MLLLLFIERAIIYLQLGVPAGKSDPLTLFPQQAP